MEKKILTLMITTVLMLALAGCGTEASKVSYNLSQQADNFNDIRQVTVINCLQGDVLFQMTERCLLRRIEQTIS